MGNGSMIASRVAESSGSSRTEEELVRSAQAGQVQAFSVLVERNQGLARAIAYSVTSDYSLTEDLAQEAMVTAWLRLGDLEEPGKFRPWLATIVRNTARYWRRHQGRHAPRAQYGLDVLEQLPDGASSPLEQALHNENLAHAQDALEGLATRYREPLLLYYSMGESHAEVASVLGVSEAAVRQRLCRARKKLRHDVSGVERMGRRLRNRASAAATVLLMIHSRQAWATHATRLAAPSALASPKLFLGLGALAGGALVACVAALVVLLSGNDPAVAQAASAPGHAITAAPPAAGTTQAGNPEESAALVSEPELDVDARGLVRIGSGKVKEKEDAASERTERAATRSLALREDDVTSESSSSVSGRIRKHGPARLLEGDAGPSGEKPLLRPNIDMRAVNREMWSED
jgi:RNA polymerase sigma-70 factor (ECF subfamily)